MAARRVCPAMDTFTELERQFLERGVAPLAGVDEVGRGPLAGPVIAAAVLFTPGTRIEGIDDSKNLSHAQRTALAEEIRCRALACAIGEANVEEIDRINILQASILAMHRAIDALAVRPAMLLVDGNRFHHPFLPYQTIIKGDSRCFSIAAASIIAKVHRDALMDELDLTWPVYGFARHRGYATALHVEALRVHGPSPVHRRSFTVRSLIQPHGASGSESPAVPESTPQQQVLFTDESSAPNTIPATRGRT